MSCSRSIAKASPPTRPNRSPQSRGERIVSSNGPDIEDLPARSVPSIDSAGRGQVTKSPAELRPNTDCSDNSNFIVIASANANPFSTSCSNRVNRRGRPVDTTRSEPHSSPHTPRNCRTLPQCQYRFYPHAPCSPTYLVSMYHSGIARLSSGSRIPGRLLKTI